MGRSDRETKLRAQMMAKIIILWNQSRPDLRHSPEESRVERLVFCRETLGLAETPESMTKLTQDQLGKVIDALNGKSKRGDVVEFRGRVDGVDGSGRSGQGGEVVHLAGTEQRWTINRIFEYLEWSPTTRAEFIQKRFKRSSVTALTPGQANRLFVILLTIAADRDLRRGKPQGAVISRREIQDYMPTMKAQLGIDSGRSGRGGHVNGAKDDQHCR